MRCLPASLRRGPGGPRCPHRSDAGAEIRDSVNKALNCLKYCQINKLEMRKMQGVIKWNNASMLKYF